MRSAKYFAIVSVAAMALSVSAFAKDNNSGKFTLEDSAKVGSTELAPGNYTAEWSGPADGVKINILKNGKTVATAEGKIKDLPQPSRYSAVSTKGLNGAGKTIDEIDFSSRREALVLSGE